MYVNNKFKLLLQKDTTVSLLVDEIHLKPYINYKGGNIVGLSDMKLQQVLLFLCLAVYSHNIKMLCMLCQLNVLNLRIYLT